jgi:methionine-S-sulfoxide reductase
MQKIDQISLGAGCFWGVQYILDSLDGIIETNVGYQGGHLENPTYQEVCQQETGHIEVVLVKYDSTIVSLEKILDYFWRLHDPTTPNRQGVDIGPQYQSALFYYSEEQKQTIEASKDQFNQLTLLPGQACTLIKPAKAFYPAEEYHQKYFHKNDGPVCHRLRDEY